MFKGNRKKYDISQGKQRFSIRKFKFGAASIAIAFMVGGQAVVSAAEPNTVTSDTAVNANVIPAKESKATRQDVTSQPTATTETPKTETPKTEIPKTETPKEEVKKEKEKTSDTSLDNELKTPNLDINQLIRGGARTVAEDSGDVWSSQIGNVQTKSKEFNDGALKNVKSYISEDKYGSAGQTEIANRYRTIEKTEIKARYVEENGQKYIDYDVYFQNDGKSLTGNAQNAFWFYGPRDIMELGNSGGYNSDTLTNRSFTRYKLKPGMQGHLSQNPERFEQVGSTFNIPNGDYGEKDAPNDWGGKNFYQLSGGPNSDNQRQQMLKNLAGNAELNKIIRRSNNQYPKLSYSQLLTVGSNQQYAYKYHVRVKLKSTVTQDEADKSGVIAVTAKAGLASEAKQAYVMASMGTKLGKTQSEEYSPVGNLLTVQKGHKITAEDLGKHITHKEGTKPLPSGYTVEAISVPETNSVGDYTAQALVRYPDGSREFVNVPVKVVEKDTQAPTLTVNPDKITVKKGEDIKFTVTATDDQDVELQLKDLLSKFEKAFITTRVEYKYTTKTATKVVLEVTIKKAQLDDTKTVTFGAVDKAGHKVEKNLDITVIEPDKDKYQPEYPSATGKPGDSVTLEPKDKTGKQIPDGTKYKVKDGSDITVDENTGKATVKIPADKKPGDVIEGKVTVTYPDGTTDEVPVKVTVSKTPDNITYSPEAKDQTVEQGTKPKAEDSIGNKDDLPKDSTYTWKKEPDTATPGEKEGVVEVTYPDGSKDEVPVKVTVTPKKTPDNENYQPEYPSATGKPGDSVTLEPKDKTGKQIPDGTKYKVKDGSDITVDENTGKATVKIPADKKPGDVIEGKVTVTYPDGTTDEVPVKVTVKEKPTDADTHEPKGKDQTVKTGETPKAEDSIANIPDLPKGTKFEFESPVDTTTPGDKTAKVKVTYPDGSKDEVTVTIHVEKKATDADTHEPKGKDQTVKTGETPKAEDSIANIPDLPKGTKFEFESPVDTTTPGDKTAKVKVTYPDGSKDEVTVTIHVEKKATDADTHEPKGKDQTVKTGETPKAEDSIANIPDLPKGTKFEFESPVDTTTPGDKTAKVKVTYPDGSKDEVTVTIHVEKKATDGNHSNGDDVTGNQINSATKTLPNTGSTVNPFFTAAAMAAIVGAGTLYGVARKKHEDDAND